VASWFAARGLAEADPDRLARHIVAEAGLS
jgi:hypothetical protein